MIIKITINHLLNKKIYNEKLTEEELFSFVDMSCNTIKYADVKNKNNKKVKLESMAKGI